MKRSVTLVIFVLLLLIAVQPALVFHFCSGRLAAMDIPLLEVESDCCFGMSTEDSQDGAVISKTCCHSSILELSTDDYVRQNTDQPVVPLVLLFIYSKNFIAVSGTEPTVSSEFIDSSLCLPTEGRSLLSRFCIYII